MFGAKLLLSLTAIVFAASINVTSSSLQGEIGSVMKFPTGMIATDKGFSAAPIAESSAGTSCTVPVIFNVLPGKANTTITAGDLVYDVQVNATTSAPTNQLFNVTLVIGSTAYGPLCVKTLVPAITETIDCRFDVGTQLPASPYTFKVTIQ